MIRGGTGKDTGDSHHSDSEEATSLEATGTNISALTGLEHASSLKHLCFGMNQTSDIPPVANLSSLTDLGLEFNQLIDIAPLVDNLGLGQGDEVDPTQNPRSSSSINIYIPQLQTRGVTIYY